MSVHIPYGIREEQGFRSEMEDERAIYEDDERDFFSAEVYDGHGGRRSALIASEMLTPVFLHEWAMEAKKPVAERRTEAAILRDAYIAVDARIGSSRVEAGTCAVQLYLIGNRFLAANAGDSRVIVGTAQGVATLTEDHKAGLEAERSRIESMGGRVIRFGVPRVEGILAISRALGDYCLKPFVIAEPRIAEGVLGRENDYALLACDGVWDVLTAEETMAAVRKEGDVEKAAGAVTSLALDRGSSDNITVIVLDLRPLTAACKDVKMAITGVHDFGSHVASTTGTTWNMH